MPATMNDDKKAYEKLVKRFPLRPIRSGEQNDRAGKICDELTDCVGDLSEAERDYLEVLSELIAKYESRWDQEALEMSPRELIHYLMGQNGLAQKDLISEFGSASRVSEFLKGERSLSLEQTKRLAYRFRLNIGALIERDDSPRFVGS